MSCSSSSNGSVSSAEVSEDSLLRSCSMDSSSDEELKTLKKKVKNLPFFYLLSMRRRNYLRSIRWSPPRLIWSDYVAELTHQNEFNVTFRMSLSSFNKLVDLLRLELLVDESQSHRASSGSRGPVLPELVVAMSLRCMVGRWAMARYQESLWCQQIALLLSETQVYECYHGLSYP